MRFHSNRNFEGRQGAGSRTHLMSPENGSRFRNCRTFRRCTRNANRHTFESKGGRFDGTD